MHLKDFETEYPFCVRFSGEKVIETGGITWCVFSYFEDSYIKLFDRGSLFCPDVHPHTPVSKLPTVKAIISHSYLTIGTYPLELPSPVQLLYCLDHLWTSQKILLFKHLSIAWAFMKLTSSKKFFQSEFPSVLQCHVLGVLNCYGCQDVPNPRNLKKIMSLIDVWVYNEAISCHFTDE